MDVSKWGWPGLVPREAQGAPYTLLCFAENWRVGGLEWSFPLLSHVPFQELYTFYTLWYFFDRLKIKTEAI